MTTKWTMTIDCADPALVARFWCTALGYVEADPPKGWDTWDAFLTEMNVPEDEWNDGASLSDLAGVLPSISFLKVPEPRTVKNRLHLDLNPDPGNRDAEIERVLALGARRVNIGQTGAESWTVLADPEGNEFCVLRPKKTLIG